MRISKVLFAVAAVLLFTSAAFAFPHDPNPGEKQVTGIGAVTGNWSDKYGEDTSGNLHPMAVDVARGFLFMTENFDGKPGGAKDLKIWNTPSFSEARIQEQASAFEKLLDGDSANETAEYTTHDELVKFVEDLKKLPGGANLTVEYLGEIPRGYPIPFLIFSKLTTERTPEGLRNTGKPLVWIQGQIHGGEKSTGEGALALAYDLANDAGKLLPGEAVGGRTFGDLLDLVNVIIIPRVCADGARVPRRETGHLVQLQWTPAPEIRDLNRDNMNLDHPIMRALRHMNLTYGPHFVVDLHERGGISFRNEIRDEYGLNIDNDVGDIGSSGTTILQATRDLIRLRYEYTEPDLAELAEKVGITFGLYREATEYLAHGVSDNYQTSWEIFARGGWVPQPGDKWIEARGPYWNAGATTTGTPRWLTNKAWDPDAPYLSIPEAYYNNRSGRNINAMPGVVSLLFENRRGRASITNPTTTGREDVAYARTLWERRVATGYICSLSTVMTAAFKGEEVLPKIENIRAEWREKGKTVTEDDKVPILVVPPRPMFWNDGSDKARDAKGDYYLEDFGYQGREHGYKILDLGTDVVTDRRDISNVKLYDGTKALAFDGSDYVPATSLGDPEVVGTRDKQVFKFEHTWLGWALRERIRPYAYIFEGEYAEELATRMMLAGIEVKRLAEDVTIDVEGWHYKQTPYVNLADSATSGWGGRNVNIYPIKDRKFEKDAYVVYLGQLAVNLIPMYFEPDLPWNVASCIFLPYMSVALGGPSTGLLSPKLVGVEMPAYRYLKETDLPTYDMNHWLPLVDRGAVARFFNYPTQEEVKDVAIACGKASIKVYNYDFQVHAKVNNLVDGKFNITLPTSGSTKGYLILKKGGGYEELTPHSTMAGWNVATVSVADHGNVPFTVDLDEDGRPIVGDGSNRTVPHALPSWDDLIGVRIVEIYVNPILEIFIDGELPDGYEEILNGVELLDLIEGKGAILSNSLLDGWSIVGIAPASGDGWKAEIVDGKVVVTCDGDAFDQVVTVTVQKDGSTETKDILVMFSGEKKKGSGGGCNTGFALLAMTALAPIVMRRRG